MEKKKDNKKIKVEKEVIEEKIEEKVEEKKVEELGFFGKQKIKINSIEDYDGENDFLEHKVYLDNGTAVIVTQKELELEIAKAR